jgi:phosphoglycerate dehydrogenase-like enzyme
MVRRRSRGNRFKPFRKTHGNTDERSGTVSGFRVHLHGGSGDGFPEKLGPLLDPSVDLTHGETVSSSGGDFRVLVSGRPPPELLEASSVLESLIIPWAGLPGTTSALMAGYPGVRVYNIHHNAGAASEMAVALMLAAAKRIVPAHNSLARDDWTVRYTPEASLLVQGSEVLVLGYGSIGRRIGEVCRCMGASVKGIRRNPGPGDADSGVHPTGMLRELLPGTDILHVCLPLTAETRGIMGDEELSLLPGHAVIVNVARGDVICEEPLYRHLESGSIGAAGLDVWYAYPRGEEERSCTPPSAFPFSELDNVVMSPHRGGAFGVGRLEELRAEHLAETINLLAGGMEPPGRVDLELGY